MITAEQIIKFFQMKPLPQEGGFYTETCRAKEKIKHDLLGERSISTAILYLLTPDTCSKMHRLKQDEIFHFYLGDPVTMLHLYPDRTSKIITLGTDILNGQQVQVTVPKNTWQGCFLNKGGKFALMGCTVTPGFEFDDYQSAQRDELLKLYPDQQDLVVKLTR